VIPCLSRNIFWFYQIYVETITQVCLKEIHLANWYERQATHR
jgi:hypothetical protein